MIGVVGKRVFKGIDQIGIVKRSWRRRNIFKKLKPIKDLRRTKNP